MNQKPETLKKERFPALKYRDFRLFWGGRFISTLGSQMLMIALNWQIFALLHGTSYTLQLFGKSITLGADALGLGTLGLVRVIPIIIFALLGGLVADALDRRKLLLVTQTLAALLSLTLAILTFTDTVSVTAIYAISAGAAAITAFDEPARQSLVPHLVPRKHLTNAVSLNTLLWYTGSIIGPGLAGLMIAAIGTGWVYTVDAVSFGGVIVALALMDYRGQETTGTSGLGWEALKEGVRFTRHTPLIWSTMLLDFFATFFSSARTMLPIIATDILGMGVQGYGLLATAQPVGAVLAGAIVAYRKDIRRQGSVLLVSVVVYGLATALFGLSEWVVLSYILFALTGAGDTVSTVIRGTLRQLLTPDKLRGRMTSVNMVFFMGGPQLGELEAGVVAAALGVPFAIVTGGIATVLLTAWVAWKYPSLRKYTAEAVEV